MNMTTVLITSSPASWIFYATAGDKVFLIERNCAPTDKVEEAMSHLIRDCRWMFGDLRIIYMDGDDDWVEVLHDGAGHLIRFETYEGPIPVMDWTDNTEESHHE